MKLVLIDNAENMGRTLAAIRIWRGLTQTEACKQLGICGSELRRIEQGTILTEQRYNTYRNLLTVSNAICQKIEKSLREVLT